MDTHELDEGLQDMIRRAREDMETMIAQSQINVDQVEKAKWYLAHECQQLQSLQRLLDHRSQVLGGVLQSLVPQLPAPQPPPQPLQQHPPEGYAYNSDVDNSMSAILQRLSAERQQRRYG